VDRLVKKEGFSLMVYVIITPNIYSYFCLGAKYAFGYEK
jgi:hypothetical protein